MAQKHISGRQLRHGSPEETLSPGESVTIKKRGGKVFELKRIDGGEKSILEGLDKLLQEMPATEPACPVDLSRIIIEDRE
ncbi:MAG TPA: hypothetical protein VNN22_03505 [Verrucomicrobiae bacterium]|nr:hypothetical protein [Verrucomicrobiae bacterium]